MTMDGGVLDGIVITETMEDDGGITLNISERTALRSLSAFILQKIQNMPNIALHQPGKSAASKLTDYCT